MAKEKKPSGKAGKPPPRCKAILLCDQLIVDAQTGKVSVIGVFDGFVVPTMPGRTRPSNAFLQLTDGIGNYSITVEIHDLLEDRVIARAKLAEIGFASRATKGNLVIPVPPLPIDHVGVYDFVVLADGQEIDRQQFTTKLIGNDDNAEEENQPNEGP